MAEPQFDREKFIKFLSTNVPEVEGTPSLLTDESHNELVISASYFMMLRVTVEGEGLDLQLTGELTVAHLFPPKFQPFNVEELGKYADGGVLDEEFLKQVQNCFLRFKLGLSWKVEDLLLPSLESRRDLDEAECPILVSASMSRQAGQGQSRYTIYPYTAQTDHPVAIASFLDARKLDQAWVDCWQKKVQFREFT